MLKKLDYGDVKSTQVTLILSYQSIVYPYGVLEDVLVKVHGLLFPNDFVILNMEEDAKILLILERPFLETGRVMINVELSELILRCHDKKVIFNVFEEMHYHNKNTQCYRINVVEKRDPKPKNSNICEMKELQPHLKHVLVKKTTDTN